MSDFISHHLTAFDLFTVLSEEGVSLRHKHCFSAEIDAFKQAYIQRNWPEVTIFRDVVELAHAVNTTSEDFNERSEGSDAAEAEAELSAPHHPKAYVYMFHTWSGFVPY